MKSNMRRFVAIVGIGLGLMMPINMVFAHSESFKKLSAEWWQWALSIPTSENPQLDTTGGKCVVGQHGSVWFLAGIFGGGTATRTCSVPADKVLYFPVINSVNINTPNVCGQGPDNIPVEDLRALSATFIDGATNLSVEVDGEATKNLRRVQSRMLAPDPGPADKSDRLRGVGQALISLARTRARGANRQEQTLLATAGRQGREYRLA